jgi:hypothetical protein
MTTRRKPTRWADVHPVGVKSESRPYTTGPVIPRMGRSSFDVKCPFCNTVAEVFLWSLSGAGKRCANRECGALFGSSGNAYRLRAEAV